MIELVAVGVVDAADGGGHFAHVTEKQVSPLALVAHAEPAAEEHAQLATDGLQAQTQLLLDFRIRSDSLLRLVRKRHPHAGHVDHHGDREIGRASCRERV
jgi:hypothetical protein